MNIFTLAQICGRFSIIFNTFFLLFITSSISLSYKSKIYLALLFKLKNPKNQYMSHKKYGVHLYKKEMDLRLSPLMIVIGRFEMDM